MGRRYIMSVRFLFCLISICTFLVIAALYWLGFTWSIYVCLVVLPFFLLGLFDLTQKKKAILRNFPILGHMRYLFLKIRPEIHQYFVESNEDGKPFSFEKRETVYSRSNKTIDTLPFGTRVDIYRNGYEWINHSLAPRKNNAEDLRVTVGSSECQKPYSASILNISAMSYGALSKNAIMALNAGAKLGNFAHNTGEGGLSPYHVKNGGDLIWQLGTAYFGTRTKSGEFCESTFREKSQASQVKMIEIKLSQGAKPGKGGILPGEKVSKEVANIRGVEIGQTVYSPAKHSTFSSPIGLLKWVQKLRDLSGGKPIGFKLCLGKRREFYSICKAMVKTNIKPDFITVDGGEGGTGSAPVEFSNSVGTPLTEALIEVNNALIGFDLRQDVTIIASGKVTTGFHIVKYLSLGADMVNVARGFMLSLGCIQALTCNSDHCPTGVATQKPHLVKGLSISDKKKKVKNFHGEIIHSVIELLNACGVESRSDLKRWHILKRVAINKILNFSELFPYPDQGALLNTSTIPENFKRVMSSSQAEVF